MSLNDQALLSGDGTFQGRVKEALAAACIAITNEAVSTASHYKRAQFAVQVLTGLGSASGTNWIVLFAQAAATDSNVIADATAGPTVLTSGNVAAQAALVTDAHINNAISGQFNSFFVPF